MNFSIKLFSGSRRKLFSLFGSSVRKVWRGILQREFINFTNSTFTLFFVLCLKSVEVLSVHSLSKQLSQSLMKELFPLIISHLMMVYMTDAFTIQVSIVRLIYNLRLPNYLRNEGSNYLSIYLRKKCSLFEYLFEII